MKVAVCDPSLDELQRMKEQLKCISYVKKIDLYSNMNFLFDEVMRGEYYDIIFLEIEWEEKITGIDYAKDLQKGSPYTKIIYMSACAVDYIEDIFLYPSNLSGFIMKPVKQSQIERNIEKVRMCKLDIDGKLIIRYKGSILAIPFEDIIYLESRLHKVNIILTDNIFQCNEQLEQISERLNHNFIKCHKSYVVNIEQVRMFCRNEIVLKDARRIPVSKTRYKETKERIFEYLNIQE